MKKPFEHFEVKEGKVKSGLPYKTDWTKEDRDWSMLLHQLAISGKAKETIESLLFHEREEILDQVEKEVIGEDEEPNLPVDIYRNTFRAEQRQKLSALRLPSTGKGGGEK